MTDEERLVYLENRVSELEQIDRRLDEWRTRALKRSETSKFHKAEGWEGAEMWIIVIHDNGKLNFLGSFAWADRDAAQAWGERFLESHSLVTEHLKGNWFVCRVENATEYLTYLPEW